MTANTRAVSTESLGKLREFYEDHLFGQILTFWLSREGDPQYRGYCTRFANRGGKLLCSDQFTWPRRRFVSI